MTILRAPRHELFAGELAGGPLAPSPSAVGGVAARIALLFLKIQE